MAQHEWTIVGWGGAHYWMDTEQGDPPLAKDELTDDVTQVALATPLPGGELFYLTIQSPDGWEHMSEIYADAEETFGAYGVA